jgi:hypothetical protein
VRVEFAEKNEQIATREGIRMLYGGGCPAHGRSRGTMASTTLRILSPLRSDRPYLPRRGGMVLQKAHAGLGNPSARAGCSPASF